MYVIIHYTQVAKTMQGPSQSRYIRALLINLC